MQHDAIEQALDQCFDAIFAPEKWSSAMDALSASLGGLGCCLNPNSRTAADRFRLPASARYRDMLNEFVSGGWKEQDLRNSRGWKLAVAGKPLVFESDCSTPEERRKLPIYAELFTPHELEIFVGITLKVNGEPWAFNLVRSEKMGGFEYGDADTLLKVRPSLTRMLRVASQMATASAQGAVSAFERADLAAVLIDNRGYVINVNAGAERLMGDAMDICQRRLIAHNTTENTQLQALIGATIAGTTGCSTGPVLVRRPGKPPLVIEAVEMHNLRADLFGFSGALLIITDPLMRRRPHLEILRQAFGLTPQEAKVGRLLSAGLDSGEIAQMLELRPSSVQQIIKSVLAKTNTHRQSALVALLMQLPGDTKPEGDNNGL